MRRFALLLLCLVHPPAANAEFVRDKPFLALDPGGHTARIGKVLFTPDGNQVVTVSDDKTARLWDVATGTNRLCFPAPHRTGSRKANSTPPPSRAYGTLLALGGYGWKDGPKPIYLVALPGRRNARNLAVVPTAGRIERLLVGHQKEVYALAFSPDGKWLASGSGDRHVCIWDVATGERVQTLEGHKDRIVDVAFSPDGRRLASGSDDGTARLWSVAGWQPLSECNGHHGAVAGIAWSLDSNTLATGNEDQTIQLWDTGGKAGKVFGPLQKEITSISFNPDGQTLLLTCTVPDGVLIQPGSKPFVCSLFDLTTRRERLVFTAHTNTVQAGAISPDGTLAVTSGGNDQETFIWRTKDGQPLQRLAGKGHAVWSTAWRSDGYAIGWGNTESNDAQNDVPNAASPLERLFDLVDLSEGPPLTKAMKNLVVEGVEWTFARNLLTSGLVPGIKPRANTLAVNQETKPLKLTTRGDRVRSFTWLATKGDSAGQVAVGGSYGLTVFDTNNKGLPRTCDGHTGAVWAISASPKENGYLLTASDDQTLRIWVPKRDEPLLSLFFAGNEWIAWTPEGYYAASGGGESLMGWHINGGENELATFHPAQRFHDSLYKPEVIKRLLDAGSVEAALKLVGGNAVSVGQVLPPQVEITSPKHGAQLAAAEVTVEARAKGTAGHPVHEIKLVVDGRSYERTRAMKNIERAGPKAGQTDELRKTWTVTLSPGKHRLAVQAETDASKALSNEVEVSAGPAATGKGNLFVLAIGISKYKGKLKLNYAADDATELKKAFEEKCQSLFDRVCVKLVLNEEATRERILNELKWLQEQMTDADVGIITFSGHGDRDDQEKLYLAPVDIDPKNLTTTGVAGSEVKKMLESTPGRFVLLLDACHSGAFGSEKRKALRGLKAANDNLARELLTPDYGVIVMCSSTRSQVSIESDDTKQGYFTKALLDGLRGKPFIKDGVKIVPVNKDGVVTTFQLEYYVHEVVLHLSEGDQEPVTGKPPNIKPFALSKP